MVSKAQQRATQKYNARNYDEIKFRVDKGCRAIIKAHAAKQGESLTGFITRAILETMKRDNAGE